MRKVFPTQVFPETTFIKDAKDFKELRKAVGTWAENISKLLQWSRAKDAERLTTVIEGEVDHGALDGLTDDDHPQYNHDYSDVSGNDAATNVTAAELEELSDGSETTLHSHAFAGLTLVPCNIEIHTGAAPTSWADLDTTVGAEALVFISILSDASGMGNVAIRRNGDTDEYISAAGLYGAAGGLANSVHRIVLTCFTDADGIIEWEAGAAGGNDNSVKLIGYIKE